MKVFFSERAKKDWRRLGASVQEQLRKKLAFYVQSGKPLEFAERLKDYEWGEYRFRVGSHRIVFDVRKDAIIVLRVGDRRDIYKK